MKLVMCMRIIASDFDNTIYYLKEDKRNYRNELNVEAINNFINQGNIFIIITGRNYADLKGLLTKLGLKYTYLVCLDGAKIFNNVDYCLDTTYINPNEVLKIKDILDEIKCDYYLDNGYSHTDNINDTVKVVVETTDEDNKINIVNKVKEKMDVHVYKSRFHVNLIEKSVNKRDALKKLFELENLDFNKLTCIGDNDNDYLMLKEYNSVVIKDHNEVLNKLNLTEYETIKDFIEDVQGK